MLWCFKTVVSLGFIMIGSSCLFDVWFQNHISVRKMYNTFLEHVGLDRRNRIPNMHRLIGTWSVVYWRNAGGEQSMGRLTNTITRLEWPKTTHIPWVHEFHHVFITSTNYPLAGWHVPKVHWYLLLARGPDMYLWKQLIPKCANGA